MADLTKLVIIGARGQLGKALVKQFPEALALGRGGLDVSDAAAVEAFDWPEGGVILNAAAYTNVDGAETAEGRVAAWRVNAQAVANLARAAVLHDLTLVQVSSEYVFDGTQSPHGEDEPVSPLGVYAQAKAAGDIAAGVTPKHYVVRTSWLIGDGPNFVRTMMSLAKKDVSPKVVDDQIGRLTFTTTLVDGIEHLLRVEAPFGIYNVSNDGEAVSWAEVTRAVFAEMGRDDLIVADISTQEYFAGKPEAAPRPLQSALDLAKIKATGFAPADWRDELRDYVKRETAPADAAAG